MLFFCLTLFLSACVSDPAAGCGLNGFYANMDQFTVYEFKNDDTLARSVVFYDAYLESKGYSVEDVTESAAAAEGGEM